MPESPKKIPSNQNLKYAGAMEIISNKFKGGNFGKS